MGIGVPYVSSASTALRWLWFLLCLLLVPYPLLPVDAGSWPLVGVLAVALAVVVVLGTDRFLAAGAPADARGRTVLGVQLLCAVLQCGVTFTTDLVLRRQQGLPVVNQVVSWGCILVGLLTLGHKQPTPLTRCRSIALGLLPTYTALSVGYEGLVYVSLASLVLLWLKITDVAAPHPQRQWDLSANLGCALLFLFCINAAFFATGNLASVSSFEISSTYRLTTAFNPFFMGFLLISKMLVPWMAVVAPFVGFMRAQGQAPVALFALTFVYTDAMALHFFFWVQHTGSWKDIGHSISRFAILNFIILVILLLSALAGLLLGSTESAKLKA